METLFLINSQKKPMILAECSRASSRNECFNLIWGSSFRGDSPWIIRRVPFFFKSKVVLLDWHNQFNVSLQSSWQRARSKYRAIAHASFLGDTGYIIHSTGHWALKVIANVLNSLTKMCYNTFACDLRCHYAIFVKSLVPFSTIFGSRWTGLEIGRSSFSGSHFHLVFSNYYFSRLRHICLWFSIIYTHGKRSSLRGGNQLWFRSRVDRT